MQKSTDTERRPKRWKEVVEKSTQPKRCRVKMLMIWRPKPCDIPPSLPSLRMYEDYVNEEDTIDTTQTVHTFQSSVPVEGEIVIHPVVYDDDVETTDVIDVDTEMDVQNVVSNVQSFKQEHHFEQDVFQVAGKKKKIGNISATVTRDVSSSKDIPSTVAGEVSTWQTESVVKVPYIDLGIDVAQVHTFANVQDDNVEAESLKVDSRKKFDEDLEKVGAVKIKKEVVDTESDDCVVTFVEHRFPTKQVKKEPRSSSRTKKPMKLISGNSADKEYQRRIKILAEVHRPQEGIGHQSILDHDYVPQDTVEVASEPTTSKGKTREQEMKRIKEEDVNPELDVFYSTCYRWNNKIKTVYDLSS